VNSHKSGRSDFMVVIFISQSQKKARLKTCQVLDLYADRIGSETWKTNITLEGLKVVKAHLAQTASKNTSVACHWLHKSKDSELLWVVGSRLKFTYDGIVPIATTSKNLMHNEWERQDDYLPIIKCLVALAALFHDVGKASDGFQNMLKKKKSDVIRHEYISMLIFQLFISNRTDEEWLKCFSSEELYQELKIKSEVLKSKKLKLEQTQNYSNLVLIMSYLILSHHKKPFLNTKFSSEYKGEAAENLNVLFEMISAEWGYHKTNEMVYENSFSKGILFCSDWIKEVNKWSKRLLLQLDLFNSIENDDIIFMIVKRCRLYMMMGDYYYSSKARDENFKANLKLYANTYKDEDGKSKLKQYLEEHLLGVEREALKVIYSIRKSEFQYPYLSKIKALNKISDKNSKFYWQDRCASKLKKITDEEKKESGFFCVNLASTGTGKTFANAKIINSMYSENENIRFNVALGLRSLTLQTGDMYREKMHIDNTDLAVVIGSSAIEKLNNLDKEEIPLGRSLFDEIDYKNIIPDNALNNVIKNDKEKKFLCVPICVSTIDHLIPASESFVGGQWIVPFLRLSSSDLIIDEIDDFVEKDLIAIAHLVYLAGLLGRRVVISSATITQSIAKGYYRAYAEGWKIFNNYYKKNNSIITCFVDEFSSSVEKNLINDNALDFNFFDKKYNIFVDKRILSLKKAEHENGIKRKGHILEFSKDDSEESIFNLMLDSSLNLHNDNYVIDKKTNKKISFGLIRFAHISTCISFCENLDGYKSDDHAIFYICYHSRNLLLVRNEIESYIDKILNRSGQNDDTVEFEDPVIRSHIEGTDKKNIIFVIISTPVEEVGRDHDFDWAIVEPSSVRSIIQLSGRVLRHRKKIAKNINVEVLQYNISSLKDDERPVYINPGYEKFRTLTSHNIKDILEISEIERSINSIPRLKKIIPEKENNSFINLEHDSISYSLLNFNGEDGPDNLNGYYRGYWAFTGLPEILAPFRKGAENIKVYCIKDENDNYSFYEKDDFGHLVLVNKKYNLSFIGKQNSDKDWLDLDFNRLLDKYSEKMNLENSKVQKMFSYVEVPEYLLDNKELYYSIKLGLNRR
jgi:CRISPR-associated endonuclease/helicase Cas3